MSMRWIVALHQNDLDAFACAFIHAADFSNLQIAQNAGH